MKRLEDILRARLRDHTWTPPEGVQEEVLLRTALRDKLHNYAEQPPAGVWEGIEQALPSVLRPRRTRPLWLRATQYAAAACVLIAVGLGGWRYFSNQPQRIDAGQLAAVTPPESTQISEHGERNAENGTREAARSRREALPAATQPRPGQSSPSSLEREGVVASLRSAPVTLPDATPSSEPRTPNSESVDQPVTPPSAAVDPSDDHLADRASWRPIRSRRTPLSASLHASDFALTTAVSGSQNPYSGTGYLASRALDSPSRPAAPDLIPVSHRAPLSLGLEVAFDISKHTRLHTGLNYNYLRSDFDRKNTPADQRIRQQLHYIGVPIAVSYDFYSTPGVDLYVRGGGTLEKGIYGVHKGSDGNNRLKMSGIQPSIHAAAGIEMTMGRATGLYFEPGVVYYPRLESQPASYRSEHPVTFSLRAGVRININ